MSHHCGLGTPSLWCSFEALGLTSSKHIQASYAIPNDALLIKSKHDTF